MAFTDRERRYLETARVGRLATADAEGRPHVVPICFALVDDRIATPIDEKPKAAAATDLRRVRDVRANPRIALVVDHYVEDWADLGWVQVRGTATVLDPGDGTTSADDADAAESDATEFHDRAVTALRAKYDQYADHDLPSRPILRIDPGHVVSWGRIDGER